MELTRRIVFLACLPGIEVTAFCASHRSASRLALQSSFLDEYDQFAVDFERALRSGDWANNRQNDGDHDGKAEEDSSFQELSRYFRRDRSDYAPNGKKQQQPAPDNSDIPDPDGLRRLLQRRFEARRAKDFERVSVVDGQLLRDHGVRAFDHPPIWTRSSQPPKAYLRHRAQKQKAQYQQLYGPWGHPYRQVGETTKLSLSMAQVHTSLSRRTRCRTDGRYEEADAIKFELSLFGIRIHDDYLQWTADDQHKFKPMAEDDTTMHTPPPYWDRQPLSTPTARRRLRFGGRTSEEDELRRRQRVGQLVQSRSEALGRDELELANSLALELRQTYEVVLDDSTRTWWIEERISKTDGASFKLEKTSSLGDAPTQSAPFPGILFGDEARAYDSPITYALSTRSLPLQDPSWMKRVKDLVRERIHKREEAKFLEADAIRRELWHTYVSKVPCPGCVVTASTLLLLLSISHSSKRVCEPERWSQ